MPRRPCGSGGAPDRPGRVVDRGPRRVVARARRPAAGPTRSGLIRCRAAAVHHVHERDHSQAEGDPAHHRGLSRPHLDHPPPGVRSQTGDRRLLDGGGHRVGDRTQLHRLRTPGQRRHLGDVRGDARRRRARPLVAHHRRVQGVRPLHRSHHHSHAHEVGRGVSRRPRPLEPSASRLGRRADQP